jgi:hypothetical protein
MSIFLNNHISSHICVYLWAWVYHGISMYHNVAIYVAKRRFFQRGKKRAGGTVEWTARPCWDCWDCWDWEYLQTSVDMKINPKNIPNSKKAAAVDPKQ